MKYAFLCSAALLLTACEGGTVRDSLGLTHRAPDEFQVVTRPPLSVPPEFNLRPPPKPGDPVQSITPPPATQAESLIEDTGATALPGLQTGNAETAVQPVSAQAIGTTQSFAQQADSQFLQDAGTASADSTIREKLSQEAAADQNQSMLDKLSAPSNNQPVVNAEGEAARLKGDKLAGVPPTTGDTPMSKASDTGTLGRIFGY